MKLNYSYKPKDASKAAAALGRELNVSFKGSVVVADFIRGMTVSEAAMKLTEASEKKRVIPYKKFRKGIGHRRGQGKDAIGKYPLKVIGEYLKVLANLTSNAEFKGLDGDELVLTHIQAQKGFSRARRRPKGRWRMWSRQYVSIQAVAEEVEGAPKPKKKKAKPEEGKAKPAEAKEEKKEGKPEEKKPKDEKKEPEAKDKEEVKKEVKPKKDGKQEVKKEGAPDKKESEVKPEKTSEEIQGKPETVKAKEDEAPKSDSKSKPKKKSTSKNKEASD